MLKLVTSYENRIATVEELITKAYRAAMSPPGGLDLLDGDRERLVADLRRAVAGCQPSRKKEFERRLDKALAGASRKREAIEDERRKVREQVAKYLEGHKQLADYLRRRLVEQGGQADSGTLNAMIGVIRARYEDMGRRLLAGLREFQSHLEAFRREQEEINARIEELVAKSGDLSPEDVGRLETAGADRERRAGRGLRHEEVESLLAYFRRQRLESRCN
jgi:prefoldin subunit 5